MKSIGATKSKMGDVEGALEGYAEAKRIYVATGTLQTPDGAGLLMSMRTLKLNMGDIEGCVREYKEAVRMWTATGTLQTASAVLVVNRLAAHGHN